MMRARYGTSVWLDSAPRTSKVDAPRFRGELSAPVVIVGGGLTGCAVAYACGAAGIKVVLLEADRVGRGPSARGDGVARAEPARSFRDLEKQVGRRAARSMFDASRRAVLDLATTARRLSGRLKVDIHDALRIAGPFAPDAALQKEAAARADADIDARWMKADRASAESHAQTTGAMRMKTWGAVDPHGLAVSFAKAAVARGATIFERTLVRKIRPLKRHVEVHTEGGVITADTVVVCTGEPTDLFRPLKRHFRFEERFLVATEPLPAAVRRQLFTDPILTDRDTPPHLIRRIAGERLLIAGADQRRTKARTKDKLLVQRTGQLMYELLRLYPAISGVQPSYGWDVPLALSSDDVMVAGPHRNYPRHLFAWGTGHDPAQAFLASRIVLRHLQGDATRDDLFFAFTRG
jgi:glycine/D-amino acid oxidase-like deaminating enzyme